MVNSCAAYGCNNRSSKEGNISFHKFPLKDKILCKKWVIATKRAAFVPTDNSKLCSQHFASEDFIWEDAKRSRLVNDAVSTIFDFPDHLKPQSKRRNPPKKRTHFTNLPHTSNRGLKKFISSAPANIHSKEGKTSSQAPNPTSVSLFQTTLSDKAPLIYSF